MTKTRARDVIGRKVESKKKDRWRGTVFGVRHIAIPKNGVMNTIEEFYEIRKENGDIIEVPSYAAKFVEK